MYASIFAFLAAPASAMALCLNPLGCQPKTEADCVKDSASAKTETAAKALIAECRKLPRVTLSHCKAAERRWAEYVASRAGAERKNGVRHHLSARLCVSKCTNSRRCQRTVLLAKGERACANQQPTQCRNGVRHHFSIPPMGNFGSQLGLSMASISFKSSLAPSAPAETDTTAMASITIRNLDDEIVQRLRVRAAERGHSMEEEARDILRRVTSEGSAPRNLAAAIRARVAPADRVDLALPVRQPMP